MAAAIAMPAVHVVDDIDTVRALSDPLRLNLMDEIGLANDRGEFRTVKQLAAALGATPHRLYYHIRQLKSFGLIRVAETRVVSGIIEKHYALTARRVEISPGVFEKQNSMAGGDPPEIQLFDAAIHSTRRDLLNPPSAEAGDRAGPLLEGRKRHITHDRVLLSPEQVRAFHARLLELVESFSAAGEQPPDPGARPFTLLTVLAPSASSQQGRS